MTRMLKNDAFQGCIEDLSNIFVEDKQSQLVFQPTQGKIWLFRSRKVRGAGP
jgi:hypothetical protein